MTTLDIKDDHGFDIQAVQADTVPTQLANSAQGTVAVINGNYALQAGLRTEDALAVEDASGDAAQTYANVIAVRNGDENTPVSYTHLDVYKRQVRARTGRSMDQHWSARAMAAWASSRPR